jgi:hypothetical protein
MRRALTSTVTAVALAALAATASAQGRTHVRDVRVGAHPEFDRVVVELDGPADVAWERGPEPGAESFYLDADLGRRERIVRTDLAKVGTITLRAMRVGTQVSLEPQDRRVRAYLLEKPMRLVIDLAAPGAEEFAVPKGVTPLAPAKSVGRLEDALVPAPEPAPEAEAVPTPPREPKPEPTPEPQAEPPQAAAPVAQPPSAEPAEGAVEGPSAPPAESEAAAPEAAPGPAEAEPVAPGPAAETQPEPAPEPEAAPAPATPPESEGFPWILALVSLGSVGALVALALVLRMRSAPPQGATTAAALRSTLIGVDSISTAELRGAADATSVLEQRLDEEVRARVALEERLSQAGEELKVLRDRLHRVERRREDAH